VEARRTRTLTIHADYACRHAGACCTSGWPIPIEADCEARLVRAHGAAIETLLDRTGALPAGTTAVSRVGADGACVFYAAAPRGGGRCSIQRG